MYQRTAAKELVELAAQYPIVTLTGPRQSGKTTLVRLTFPDKPYANLESPDERAFALTDPRAFLARYPNGAILDEIQRAPELLSYLQPLVDESTTKGMFILTGSHQLELHEAISQSLAGRTALLTLLPMSLHELDEANHHLSVDDALLMGGYPRIFHDHLNPTKAYRNYFQTYIERDLRQLINVKDLMQFQKFVYLLAGRVGQQLNMNSLSGEVGVSAATIKHWISILEASFIIIRLQPYFENLGKRITKSPKLYFTDVGLATYLLGIENTTQVSRDPLRGALFENLVLLELLKARTNQGLNPNLYYFRDVKGNEVDIIFRSGNDLIPIEVKSTSTFNPSLLKSLKFFQKLVGTRAPTAFLVYSGSQQQRVGSITVTNHTNAHKLVQA